MSNALIIVGVGPGMGLAVADIFGHNGYKIGLISRNPDKLSGQIEELTAKGIQIYTEPADAANPESLKKAISSLQTQLGTVSALIYNAAAMREQDIMSATDKTLIEDYRLSVTGALQSVQLLHADLKANHGVVLFTGGVLALSPYAGYGSLSLGKAGIRNLAQQLHARLKEDNIYVGTLTIAGGVNPDSATHSPAVLADVFWQMAQKRTEVEVQQ